MELVVLIIAAAPDEWRVHVSPARARVSDSALAIEGDYLLGCTPDLEGLERRVTGSGSPYRATMHSGGGTIEVRIGSGGLAGLAEWLDSQGAAPWPR